MMQAKNDVYLEGYIYDIDKLEVRTTGEHSKKPGTSYISGNLVLATDDEMLNTIRVHYSYTTPTTSKGKANPTYQILQDIIDGNIPTVVRDGKERAVAVQVTRSRIDLNEFYDMRTPEQNLVTQVRNEGGFIRLINAETLREDAKSRSFFDMDMLITGTRKLEADEERNLPEKMYLKGYVFNSFRNTILPVELAVMDPRGMNYFEGLGATSKEPVLTEVRGHQVSTTIVTQIEEESAFGDSGVREVRSTQRDYVVNWAKPEPYTIGDNNVYSMEDLKKMMQERELYLAEVKKRQLENQQASAFAVSDEEDFGF